MFSIKDVNHTIIKKDDKKGILISKFEVCAPVSPEPQKPAPVTQEIEIKK